MLLSTQPPDKLPHQHLHPHASTSAATSPKQQAPASKHLIVNGVVTAVDDLPRSGGRVKKFFCTYPDCGKSYTRPVRLEEHIRAHTGERPFQCPSCDASFGRDSHLKAHVRTHAGKEQKRYECQECDKKFWTNQHLKKHSEVVHRGKTYDCPTCGLAFRKHHLLRTHIVEAHSPPGSLPFPCTHPSCMKSFRQLVHLKAHLKTHDVSRYQCAHPDCLVLTLSDRQFATWTALQKHSKSAHPPTCPYDVCERRTFTTPRGLRGHLEIAHGVGSGPGGETKLGKRRRARELAKANKSKASGEDEDETGEAGEGSEWEGRADKERDERIDRSEHGPWSKKPRQSSTEGNEASPWCCSQCTKRYQSFVALESHVASKHAEDASGVVPLPPRRSAPKLRSPRPETPILDFITGRNYSFKSSESTSSNTAPSKRRFHCPFPAVIEIGTLLDSDDERGSDAGDDCEERLIEDDSGCQWWFARVYDVERHLRAKHGLEVHRAELAEWLAGDSDDEDV